MAQLTTEQYDMLERAIRDHRRIAVMRRGTEYVIEDAPLMTSWYRVKAVDNSSNASAASSALAAAMPGNGSSDATIQNDPGVTRASRP